MSIAYRLAGEHDVRFVVESWIDSYRCSHAAGLIAMDDWHDVMEEQVIKVLDRPDVVVRVACNPKDRSHRSDLYGWAAVETAYQVPVRERVDGRWQDVMRESPHPLVHYVFVKQAYRRMGVAKGLLKQFGVTRDTLCNYTCKTAVLSKMRLPHARWTPLVARHTKRKPNEATEGKEPAVQPPHAASGTLG